MDLVEIVSWLFSIIAVFGTYLLTQGSIHGFTTGVLTNGAFFILNLYNGIYPQAFLFFVNLIVSAYGVWNWNNRQKTQK